MMKNENKNKLFHLVFRMNIKVYFHTPQKTQRANVIWKRSEMSWVMTTTKNRRKRAWVIKNGKRSYFSAFLFYSLFYLFSLLAALTKADILLLQNASAWYLMALTFVSTERLKFMIKNANIILSPLTGRFTQFSLAMPCDNANDDNTTGRYARAAADNMEIY